MKIVVLSGGVGSRLWPLSRDEFPKQYLQFWGEKTLFQQAATLSDHIGGSDKPMIICNADHRFIVAEQLSELGLKCAIVLEPVPRNTAPAIVIAALLALPEDPVLMVTPADHVIRDKAILAEAAAKAETLAEQGKLVTFGVTPTRPETGYGYIRCGEKLGEFGYKVAQFVEKPDRETAEQYLISGDYFWNSGIFIFRASSFLAEMEKFEPEMVEACRAALAGRTYDADFIRVDEAEFAKAKSISLDYALMEKTGNSALVPLNAGWSDLGSWDAVHDIQSAGKDGNVLIGDVIEEDCQGCYLQSEKRLLAAVGLKNLIIVETADAVLVADKDKAQQVKKINERLKKSGRKERVTHRKCYKPWGFYESIDFDQRFQVKRITVKAGESISLQIHHHRSEHWVVVKGTAKITNGDEVFYLYEDQSTYIPMGSVHKLENPGKIPLELIEIQTGTYLEEDDIIRLEDHYQR